MYNQFSTETNNLLSEEVNPKKDETESQISTLSKIEDLLNKYSSKEIIFTPPLITRSGIPIIKRKTINMIQGKFGTHKSRIAELLCSLMLSKSPSDIFLGFERDFNQDFTVVYLDSERNYEEEFASTIQSIRKNAGFKTNQKLENFRYSSIRTLKRGERLPQIQTYLKKIRESTMNPIFAVLDVGTDFILDFNSVGESMDLFDYLGNFTEEFGATFCVVIHENQVGGKARGNLGSEGANKSATVIRIGFDNAIHLLSSEVLELKFIKLRSAKRPNSIFLQYSEDRKALVLVDESVLNSIKSGKDIQKKLSFFAEKLGEILEDKRISQSDLFDEIKKVINIKDTTIRTRLKQIEEKEIEILNANEEPHHLKVDRLSGTTTYYQLIQIDSDMEL